jgi:UDP-N-acetylglucosamine 2-epimerase (non-hydrolysing)
VKVIGTEQRIIVNEISRLLDDTAEYERMARAVNPYGDGQASERIVAALLGEPYVPFESIEQVSRISENSKPEQVVCESLV